MRSIIAIVCLIISASINVSGQTITTSKKDSTAHCTLHYDSTLNHSYYILTEQMPQYIGGDSEMLQTIMNHLRYPSNDCCFTGSIYVSFIVEADCSMSDKRILNNKSDICRVNKQALKVLDYLTEWTPGKCNGENVAVKLTLPIRFKIE